MKVTGIDHYIPLRVVTLEETLDLFRHYSKSHFRPGELTTVLTTARKILEYTGFEKLVVRAKGEPWYRNYIEMTRDLIERSGVTPNDVDKVIYVGTGRGYREPATAYKMAQALGIRKAECFDVLDACSGWGRAARLIEPHLQLGLARHVLLLSLEFNRSPSLTASAEPNFGCDHPVYSLRSQDDLAWRLWAATVGEAGTSTLLSKDDDNGPWYFDYETDTEEHDCCGFTMRNHRDYDLEPMALDGVHGGQEFFFAFGKRIGDGIKAALLRLLRKEAAQRFLREAGVVIPHTISRSIYEDIFRSLGVENKATYVFSLYGNCVSSGIPLGLSTSMKDGHVGRGDRIVMAPCGAGNSYGVIAFRL